MLVQQKGMAEVGLDEESREEPEDARGAIAIEKSVASACKSSVCRERQFGLVFGGCCFFFTRSVGTVEKQSSFQAQKPFLISATEAATFMLRTD